MTGFSQKNDEQEQIPHDKMVLFWVTTSEDILITLFLIFYTYILYKKSLSQKQTIHQSRNLSFSSIFLSFIFAISPVINDESSFICHLQGSLNYLLELNLKFFTLSYSVALFLLLYYPSVLTFWFNSLSIAISWVVSIVFGIICLTLKNFQINIHFCSLNKNEDLYFSYLILSFIFANLNLFFLIFTLIKVLIQRKKIMNTYFYVLEQWRFKQYIIRLVILTLAQLFFNWPVCSQFIIRAAHYTIEESDDELWYSCIKESIYTFKPLVFTIVYSIDKEILNEIICCKRKTALSFPNNDSYFSESFENIGDRNSQSDILK